MRRMADKSVSPTAAMSRPSVSFVRPSVGPTVRWRLEVSELFFPHVLKIDRKVYNNIAMICAPKV